jgi:hypothetical protein
MKRKFVIEGLVALAVVWLLVWLISRTADAAIPSARKFLAWLETEPLEASPSREAVVTRAAREYAQLTFVDKRSLRTPQAKGKFTGFLASLTPAEKTQFVELVMPGGFEQLLDGFSRLSERDRTRMLERSRRELIENLPDSPARTILEQVDPKSLQHLAKDGLGTFYRALPPDARIEILPFVEQMQNNLRQLDD